MGSLCIPDNLYRNFDKINDLNNRLKNKEFKLHFTDYKKSDFVIYKDVLNAFVELKKFIKINIVVYKKDNHINAEKRRYTSIVSKMIYSKIPERVIYGSLRGYGNFGNIESNLYIEHCSQYETMELDKKIKDDLNIHSIYRHENYWVKKAHLYPKNTELGIEVIDILLGCVRLIVENKSCSTNKESYSKNLWSKKNFLIKMLKDESFYDLISQINYFELDGQAVLEEKDLKSYVNIFHSKFVLEKKYFDMRNSEDTKDTRD